MSMLFATTYPERVAALALYGTYAKRVRAADYPWAPTLEEHQDRLDVVERDWGGPVDLEAWAPSNVNDERFKRWWAQYLRPGTRQAAEPSRVLATVLFTDMVESTSRAVALGDARWRALISDHDRLVRAQLARFRGREIDRRGDGFLAIFDGPARAIRCALSIIERVHELGLQVRAGLHTGELDIIESGVA